jgi:hypothetical protein
MSRMSARDIPRWQWPAFLDQFSRTHRAWLATLDEEDEGTATAHPLRSVTPFVHNNRVVHIDIRFQDPHGREPARIHSARGPDRRYWMMASRRESSRTDKTSQPGPVAAPMEH